MTPMRHEPWHAAILWHRVLAALAGFALVIGLLPVMPGHAAPAVAAVMGEMAHAIATGDATQRRTVAAAESVGPPDMSPPNDALAMAGCKMHCIGSSLMRQPGRLTSWTIPTAARRSMSDPHLLLSRAVGPPRRPPRDMA